MQLFHSLLPLRNPLGFGAADYTELAVALFLLILYLVRARITPFARRIAGRTALSMLLIAGLAIALRLALLPNFPVPTPTGSDDFSHLLVADTLLHFRLANPPHPLSQFFEAIYVLQQPTYSSMYPLGHGVVLAAGRLIFGTPWAGTLLSASAFCALCYWMLRAWTTPVWALVGGILAVIQFGPLSQWMNAYWISTLPAVSGALVFGALPRLRQSLHWRHASILGLGLAIHFLTRPFESILLAASALLYFAFFPWRTESRRILRAACVAILVMLPAFCLTLLQNKAVTGNWTTLPYMLSRYQYGIPATFVFEPNPAPHRPLTPEQDLDYRAQCAIHGDQPETLRSYFERLLYRARYYRFYFLPALYLAVLAFLLTVRSRDYLWVLAAIAIFVLASNLYPYFYPHYIGAVTCLFILAAVTGLSKLARWNLAWPLLAVCLAHFAFWYGIRLTGNPEIFPALAYESWDFVNRGDPEGRIAIDTQLAAAPGEQLVFVRYAPNHGFHEWVHNEADIDRARVVWALDLGDEENRKLIQYFPNRKVWIVQPDLTPPRLSPY